MEHCRMLIMEIFSKEYLLHNLFYDTFTKYNLYTTSAVILQIKAVFLYYILDLPTYECVFPRTINANLPYS